MNNFNLNTPTALENLMQDMYHPADAARQLARRAPLIITTDSYKGEHWHAMNEEVDFAHLYVEARKGDDLIMVAGIRNMLEAHLTIRITKKMVDVCEFFSAQHSFGKAKFNRAGWMHIVNELDGKLPLDIKACDEGLLIPSATPMLVVRNSIKGFAWLVSYFEDIILRIWKSCAVASKAYRQKKILYKFAQDTMDESEIMTWLMYALHDFGPRSTGTSEESAVSGMGHQQCFGGSDNWEATWLTVITYGHCPATSDYISSASVFAIEHNVVLSYGKEREFELFGNLAKYILTEGRTGSILIDTYDIDAAIQWFNDNKEKLEQWWIDGGRQGKVVLRPDSGCPVEVPVMVLERLLDGYGYTLNDKGCKKLPTYIGCIQGDGTDEDIIDQIRVRLTELRIAASNIIFGQGGVLLQGHMRDDGSWASKISNNTVKGVEITCCKSPTGDKGKKSKEGYFKLTLDGNTVRWERTESFNDTGLLKYVMRAGELVNTKTHAEVVAFSHEEFLKAA